MYNVVCKYRIQVFIITAHTNIICELRAHKVIRSVATRRRRRDCATDTRGEWARGEIVEHTIVGTFEYRYACISALMVVYARSNGRMEIESVRFKNIFDLYKSKYYVQCIIRALACSLHCVCEKHVLVDFSTVIWLGTYIWRRSYRTIFIIRPFNYVYYYAKWNKYNKEFIEFII